MKNVSDTSSLGISRRGFLLAASTAGAMSIGRFDRASGATIEAGTDIVQTSGYSKTGRGAALYVADPIADNGYVTRNPRTAFISATGRGFRLSLDQTITPFLFGCVGSAAFSQDLSNFGTIPDDTIALQAFFDFCASRRVESANWGGAFGVTAQLTMGGPFGEDEEDYYDTGTFAGSIVLGVKSEIAGAVLVNQNRRQMQHGPISITGPGGGYPTYANRLFDIGIEFRDRASTQTFSTVYVAFARIAGVLIRNRVGFNDNVYQNHLENCFFYGCGGGSLAGAVSTVSTGFTGHSSYGAGSGGDATFQRSALTVTTLPPAILATIAIPLFIQAGDRLHTVVTLDRATGAVTLYPKLSTAYGATGAAGSLNWIYGGGLAIAGGDSGITTGKLSATNCATGYVAASAYNGHFVATIQNNLIGMTIGVSFGSVSLRGSTAIYCEGNTWDVWWNADNRESQSAHTIISTQNLNLFKFSGFTPRRDDDSLAPFPAKAMMINNGDRWLTWENDRSVVNGVYQSFVCEFDRPYANAIPLHNDNVTINITPDFSVFQTLFGYRAMRFDITGSGVGNKPVGTITVTNPGGGKTINGGAANANWTDTVFAGPVSLQVAIDNAGNYIVSFLGGK